MLSFHWDKYFVTGISTVDQQHQHLVDIVNQLGSHLADNELVLDDLENVFQELADYTTYHFQDEEKMMAQVGIDERHLQHHIKAHQDFLQEVTSIYSGISRNNPDTAQYLFDFLTHWLAYHMLGSDQNMARQIEAIQAGATPLDAYDTEERDRDNATAALLDALNGLFQQVSLRNEQLVQLNLVLEEKVAERTQALSDANLHLEELALTDVLTKLPNRRHAMRRLEFLWAETLEHKSSLVCMMIDADHFKEVNDTYGHDAGDLVLCELARTLENSVRTDDIVCRLGGDEFFIICPDTDQKGGMYLAESICKTVSELRVPTGDGAWQGSISVGVAASTPGMDHYEELIKEADEGVYAAKRDGKNCVRTTAG